MRDASGAWAASLTRLNSTQIQDSGIGAGNSSEIIESEAAHVQEIRSRIGLPADI